MRFMKMTDMLSPTHNDWMNKVFEEIVERRKKLKYVVLQRFGKGYITFIMILEDKEKAEALRDFLNAGKYFETNVTVEEVDKCLPNGFVIDMLSRTI